MANFWFWELLLDDTKSIAISKAKPKPPQAAVHTSSSP